MLLARVPIFSIHADCPTEISHFVSPFQRKFDYLSSIPPNKGIYTETKTSVLTIRESVVFPELNTNLKVFMICLLYTSPSPRDRQKSRMPSSA